MAMMINVLNEKRGGSMSRGGGMKIETEKKRKAFVNDVVEVNPRELHVPCRREFSLGFLSVVCNRLTVLSTGQAPLVTPFPPLYRSKQRFMYSQHLVYYILQIT